MANTSSGSAHDRLATCAGTVASFWFACGNADRRGLIMGPLQTSILGESMRQQLLDLKLAGLVAFGLFAYQCVHSINELRKRDEHNAQSELRLANRHNPV